MTNTTKDPTKPETVEVAIVGPFSSGVSMHVHMADCADLTKKKIYREAKAEDRLHVTPVSSWKDIVTFVYPESDFTYVWDSEERGQFESDFHVAPCVSIPSDDLPVPAPKAGRGYSTVSKDGKATCRLCQRSLEITKFPTKPANDKGEIARADRCRECRDFVRDGNKEGRDATTPPPWSEAPKVRKPRKSRAKGTTPAVDAPAADAGSTTGSVATPPAADAGTPGPDAKTDAA
jgi:hypothetical protein